jgi:hypothetical protein
MRLKARLSLAAAIVLAIVIIEPSAALAAPADDKPIPGLSTSFKVRGADGKYVEKSVPADSFPGDIAPSDPAQRRAWEDAPKKQHYIVPADGLQSLKDAPLTPARERNSGKKALEGDNNVVSRDPVTLDECHNHDFDRSEKPFWHKNKFSSCFAGTYTLLRPPSCPIFCDPEQINMNVDIIGVGYINYIQGVPQKKMQWTIRTTKAYANDGFDMNLPVTLAFKCTGGTANECAMSPSSFTKPLGEWYRGTQTYSDMTVTGSAEEDDPLPAEDRTYHSVSFSFTQPDPSVEPPTVNSQPDSVRCDVANYNYYIGTRAYSNGACLFTNVDSWMSYRRSSTAHGEVAQHIYDAQFRAETHTKPGINGGIIAGSRQSGYKLHRIAPISQANEAASRRNHAIAVTTCTQFWPPDYTEGNTKQCDEYPFQSTWEGAAYNERNGGSTAFSYSARPVTSSQNGSAGASLNYYYVWDHILEQDGFYVVIQD